MNINYADFTRASGLIHRVQGAALLLLGAVEAYALDNKARKPRLAAAAVLALSGVLMFAVILAMPGHWSFARLAAALALRRGFYLFIAFGCLYSAAGLSLLTREIVGAEGGSWQGMFLILLAFAGVLYFVLPWRVNEEAWRRVFIWHAAIGATLLLAVVIRAFNSLLPRRGLRLAWALLLMVTGMQLVTYTEVPGSFAPVTVTLKSSSTPAR